MDPYLTLGVPRDADAATIKRAWRKAAQMAHPDRHGGDTTQMTCVNVARDILTDPARRKRYDLGGEDVPPTPPLELRARMQLGMAFMAVVQQPARQNIPAAARRQLQANRAQLQAQLREIGALIERLQKRLADVEFQPRDGEVNVFADQVHAMLGQLTTQQQDRNDTIAAIDRAVQLLAAYRSGVLDTAAAAGWCQFTSTSLPSHLTG
jgi:curved DNA-binding protein CbpA